MFLDTRKSQKTNKVKKIEDDGGIADHGIADVDLQAVNKRTAAVGKAEVPQFNAGEEEVPLPKTCNRRIIEFCCGENSIIGQSTVRFSKGCHCVRLTQKIDVTSESGLTFALRHASHKNTLLWCSIPCTGGCPWNRINLAKRPEGQERVRQHKLLFSKLWEKFEVVASKCLKLGGVVVIEWPRRCDYWKNPRVETFLKVHKLRLSDFDGCRYGIVSIKKDSEGTPIRKTMAYRYQFRRIFTFVLLEMRWDAPTRQMRRHRH